MGPPSWVPRGVLCRSAAQLHNACSFSPCPQRAESRTAAVGTAERFPCPLHHFSAACWLFALYITAPQEVQRNHTIHSGAAGRPGINPRGNAVNSSTLFLPLAQLAAGILPHESPAVTIHHRYLGGRIPGHELASFGNSGAVSFCQMIRGRNPNWSAPRCSSPPAIFRGFQIP